MNTEETSTHAKNLNDFIWECGHLWDEERLEEVKAASAEIERLREGLKKAFHLLDILGIPEETVDELKAYLEPGEKE